MSSIKLTPHLVLTTNGTLDKVNQTLNTVKLNIVNIRTRIPSDILYRDGISQSFQGIANSIDTTSDNIKRVNQTVKESVNRYQENELYINRIKVQYSIAPNKVSANSLPFHDAKKENNYITSVGNVIKKSASSVCSIVKRPIDDIVNSYRSKGTSYKIIEYGKATFKGVKGIVKVFGGAVSLFGSGGMAAPVALLSIASGFNDIFNSASDMANVHYKNYDKVGNVNYLKDKLEEGGEIIGGMTGNTKIGKSIGTITYYGIDLVTSLESLCLSWDKVVQSDTVGVSTAAKDFPKLMKDVFQTDVKHIITTDLNQLKYETKLLRYAHEPTFDLFKNVGTLIGVGKATYDTATAASSMLGDEVSATVKKNTKAINQAFDVFDGYDKVSNALNTDLFGEFKEISKPIVKIKNDFFISKELSDFGHNLNDEISAISTTVDYLQNNYLERN